MTRRPRRRGFTLLEIILALGIGMVLMFALFVVLNSQLSHSQAGRDSIQEATVARAILARIVNDIQGTLGPYDPRQAADPPADETGAPSMVTTSLATFNVGVQGESTRLILSVGRVPREILGRDKLRVEDSALPKVSDLRRIAYWVIEGKGLARQELKVVTGEEMDSVPPDVADPDQHVLAAEVKSISFQFWDGAGWVADWDGTTPGEDGDTPIGPPAGIEITLEIGRSRYTHVVSLPTGNNYSMQQAQ
jgi:hypothetical protein